MYPLLYEASVALRTGQDEELRQYLRDEFRGAVPAWLYASRREKAPRARPRVGRALGRWISTRRSRRAAPGQETSERANGVLGG